MRKTRTTSLTSVFKTNKGGLAYVSDTLTNIISSIDPALILQDILGMESHLRVAAYLKLAEVNSKLLRDISTIEKDKFIMSLDKMDEAEEIFVVLDGEQGVHISNKPTPNMLESARKQDELFEEIANEMSNKVEDISEEVVSNVVEDQDISTPQFENYDYVAPVKVHHSPKRRKPIGY